MACRKNPNPAFAERSPIGTGVGSPACSWEPFEGNGKDPDQHRSQDDHWHGYTKDGHAHADVIKDRILLQCSHDPKRHADDESHKQRHQTQLDGNGQLLAENVIDRAAA